MTDSAQSNPYTVPPGLVGEIAQFIYNAAPRPVPEIALAGAVGLMAGIVGRAYNVSGTGLNQYVLLLAQTGVGKEGAASGITTLMRAVGKLSPPSADFLGPASIASAPALTKHLGRFPSFVSIIGEFGLSMRQMASPKAPPHLMELKALLLDLYNKSGRSGELRPTIYSDKDKNTASVQSPAFSILGESTPESFYEGLSDGLIADGLLPRFTIIEYRGKRPPLNSNRQEIPKQQLIDRTAELCAHALQLNSLGQPQQLKFTELAKAIFDDFDKECDAHINGTNNEVTRHLWNRAHIKAMKLAAIVAVGWSPYNPIITDEFSIWAIEIEKANVRNLLGRFEQGEVGEQAISETAQQSKLRKVIVEWITKPWDELSRYKVGNAHMHDDRVIPYSFISKRLTNDAAFKKDGGATQKIKRAIDELMKCGELSRISPRDAAVKYENTRMDCYMIADPAQFLRAVGFV